MGVIEKIFRALTTIHPRQFAICYR